MSKIIPIFYLPKEYPEDMRLLANAIVANDGQTLKTALNWLEGKLLSHKNDEKISPMSAKTIKNYLAGFYVLDLFKIDGKLYSDIPPLKRASVSVKSHIKVIKPLETIVESSSIELFNETLTRLVSQNSPMVREYIYNRWYLQDKYQLTEKNPQIAKLQKMLMEYCGYSYVGNPGVGYLNIFYKDKLQIDSYLKLLEFIITNYGDIARRSLGLIPVANILNHIQQVSDYTEDEFKKHLIQLQLTHRIELRTTKSQFARNIGIDLVDIRGVNYGFIKLLEPAIAV